MCIENKCSNLDENDNNDNNIRSVYKKIRMSDNFPFHPKYSELHQKCINLYNLKKNKNENQIEDTVNDFIELYNSVKFKKNKKKITQISNTRCAFCLDEIVDKDSIISCDHNCQNSHYFHFKCSAIYFRHQRENGAYKDNSIITCPLCRGKFNIDYETDLVYCPSNSISKDKI